MQTEETIVTAQTNEGITMQEPDTSPKVKNNSRQSKDWKAIAKQLEQELKKKEHDLEKYKGMYDGVVESAKQLMVAFNDTQEQCKAYIGQQNNILRHTKTMIAALTSSFEVMDNMPLPQLIQIPEGVKTNDICR
jgi:hypothetical protein